jgi:hypothetical protein
VRSVVVVGKIIVRHFINVKTLFPQDFIYLSVAKRLLPVVGKEQESLRTSQQRELVKKTVVKKEVCEK